VQEEAAVIVSEIVLAESGGACERGNGQ
jgi:hypothetical protein